MMILKKKQPWCNSLVCKNFWNKNQRVLFAQGTVVGVLTSFCLMNVFVMGKGDWEWGIGLMLGILNSDML